MAAVLVAMAGVAVLSGRSLPAGAHSGDATAHAHGGAGAPLAPGAAASQTTVGASPIALNQPADPFLGKVPPAANADVTGMYSPQVTWPLVAIHAALLPSGQVVTYGAPVGVRAQGGLDYTLWRPALGTGPGAHDHLPSMHSYDSFCNALELLPDGRVLMVGGNTTTASMVYDPATGAQTMGATLARQRWYATLLRLPDDRMLVLGGGDYYNTTAYQNPNNNSGVATVPEIGTGTGAWTQLTGAQSTIAFGARDNRWWYPRAFVAPDDRVFGVSFDRMWRLDPTGVGSVQSLGVLPAPIGVSGSSVMFEPGRILFAGGGQRFNETTEASTAAATVVNINGSSPVATATNPMRLSRHWLNLTALPNGEVFANGGTNVGTLGGAANSRYQSEIWNPQTGQWRDAATASRTRTYHSVSLLLPGGSVLTAGGGLPGPEDNLNAEIYYPPYLFTRTSGGALAWADRPEIRTIAGSAAYGGQLTLGMSDARPITGASLIKLGTVTHSLNTDQRRVPLSVQQSGATVTATMPTSRNVLPPGSYLLQTVDAAGVPSPSQIITVRSDGSPGAVTIHEPDQSPTGQPGGTSEPGIVPLTPGGPVSLEPVNFYGYRARHTSGATVRLEAVGSGSPAAARAAASFIVRPGLANAACRSFESVDLPGRYLRHQGFVAYVHSNNGTALFAADATFCPVTGLTGQYTSFTSYNFPGHYLRHANFALRIDTFDGSDGMRRDATFAVRPGL